MKRAGWCLAAGGLLILVLTGGPARAQKAGMDVVLEPGAPGEQVSLSGKTSADCEAGTPEVGLSPDVPTWFGKKGDPRTGNKQVLLQPGVGTSFDTQVTLPDPQGDPGTHLYLICRNARAIEGGWMWVRKEYRFAAGSGGQSGAAGGSGASTPLALAGVGAGVLVAAVGGVLLTRRGRRTREGGHERCEARHAEARAAVQVATMSEAARAGEALDQVGSAAREAAEAFDVLLDESAVVNAAVDEVVRRAR